MALANNDQAEAILFIEGNRVVREMLYQEFEAILDGIVPLQEMAEKTAKGVYVLVNPNLLVTAAVFFIIDFDDDGNADRRWNIPLEQLAEDAAKGPDLGAGAIKLACYSQCPVKWQQDKLWDPVMKPGANNFVLLRDTIKENRLSLSFSKQAVEAAAPKKQAVSVDDMASAAAVASQKLEKQITRRVLKRYEKEFRDHVAQLLKEQRLRVTTLNNKRKQDIQTIRLENQKRLLEYKNAFGELKKALGSEKERNQTLKAQLETQAQKVQGLREYFESKLKSFKNVETGHIEALKENHSLELEVKIEAATAELKEMIQMREVELHYRNEQIANLNEEISRLRQENTNLVNNTGDQVLDKLAQSGVNFVAYHPGAGHITIPLDDMSVYLSNPNGYAAKKCGVPLSQYENWLDHFQRPVCRALGKGGQPCGKMIDRIPSPGEFLPGENDRCKDHQTTPTQTFAAVRI